MGIMLVFKQRWLFTEHPKSKSNNCILENKWKITASSSLWVMLWMAWFVLQRVMMCVWQFYSRKKSWKQVQSADEPHFILPFIFCSHSRRRYFWLIMFFNIWQNLNMLWLPDFAEDGLDVKEQEELPYMVGVVWKSLEQTWPSMANNLSVFTNMN